MLVGAAHVEELIIPARDAYEFIYDIGRDIGHPAFVILCAGAVGTILANRLAVDGTHAIDCGYVGKFL